MTDIEASLLQWARHRCLYVDDGGGNLFIDDDDDSIFEGDHDKPGTAGVTKGCNPPVNDMYCPGSVVPDGRIPTSSNRITGSA